MTPEAIDIPNLRVSEVADMLTMSHSTAAQLMRTGEIRSTQIGKLWKTKMAWVQEYLDRKTKGPRGHA